MKILLTGGTGFIGSNLLSELSKENIIFSIVRRKNFKNTKYKKYIHFKNFKDLNNKLKKIKIDIVIHCATHYIKDHKIEDIDKFVNSNILLGNIILENLKTMKVKKFINFSTVWEDYNSIKNNSLNLYTAYKKSFSNILKFYIKYYSNIKFYNLMISETFGQNDNRKKIINVLKLNYKRNLVTNIISNKLYLNLLNVEDITEAVKLILQKNIQPGKYVLKNNKYLSISELISVFNKTNKPPIKINWLSKKRFLEKIYTYKSITSWKPKKSNITDIINIIKNT